MLTSLTAAVFVAAAASSLILAAVACAGRSRGGPQWSFVLGMLGLAAESLATLVLVAVTEEPGDRLLWLRITGVAGSVLVIPWVVFAGTLAHDWRSLGRSSQAGFIVASILAAGAGASMAALPVFQISDIPGSFYAARLAPMGQYVVIAQLLASVAVLGSLEICLRRASRDARWRLKYLLLGLSGIFLIRFYFLSQALLFHVVMAAYLTTLGAATIVGNLLIGVSLARARLTGARLVMSHQLFYRSLLVSALGLYLFVIGGLGWVLNNLGIAEELLWGSLAVFVAVLGVAVILFSENVRWRMKRFLSLHFYRTKHDYRQQWMTFTTRLGSLLALDDLGPELLGAVTGAVGTAKGLLYLADADGGAYRLAAAIEVTNPPPVLDAHSPLVLRLHNEREPIGLEDGDGLPPPFAPGGIAVPLQWHETLTGILLVGPERAGIPYGPEDREFLETVGKQVAAAIMTARLSESLARARELEAFSRLTSFVVHDLKNSISALSMLNDNAVANFDDPEFQRDALMTVSRTVERIQRLLVRLSTVKETGHLALQPIDLVPLMAETAASQLRGTRVRLVQKLEPVRPILGDRDTLELVLRNLLRNAVEAMDGDGQLTIRTEERDGHVLAAVGDTGCGMSPDFIRTSLFVPFRSGKKRGWGIGLYQSREIVISHGGRIDVESHEGCGSTFTLAFRPIEAAPSGVPS